MSMQILKQDIKNKEIRNLYLFYGQEEFLKKYYLNAIEKIIINEQFREMNKVVLEGKVSLSRLADVCETVPLFSERKLVLAKNTGLFKTGSKEAASGKDSDMDFFKKIPTFTCLVFYEEEIDKRLKIVNAVKNNGLIVEFEYQNSTELVKWVIKVFNTYNKKISEELAAQLVNYCEPAMTDILNEINKIILYMGDRKVANANDLEQVCTKSIKSKIFDLTDAISEKNSTRALKLLNDMVLLKEPIPKIIFMIARQFRLILEMKLMLNDKVNIKTVASKLKIHPFIAGKIANQAKRLSTDTLKKALERTYELDGDIKTGKINDRIAVELLIAEFCK
ncbi:MAG TPA: DNA polymerase III subunit delta [Clostridiaceae bacterium]|nr:DNA polymerase III subunit delta [Clostridiaceae bacterium]